MSWVRELSGIVVGTTHSTALPDGLAALMRRHSLLASKLLEADISAAQRLSALVELGGIEISLMGGLWAVRPVHEPRIVRGVNAALKQARKAHGDKELTEGQLDDLVRTAEALSKRPHGKRTVRSRRGSS
jgi:hypothetical protein